MQLLSGTSTYTGPTVASEGVLALTGPAGALSPASVVTVLADYGYATFGGTGSAGSVAVSGFLDPATVYSPGLSGPGSLTLGNIAIGFGGAYDVTLAGSTPGTGYTQVVGTGTVNITGAGLNLKLANGYTPAVGTTFTIIHNTGGSPITGTFPTHAQNSTFVNSGQLFSITYTGGTTGNDVVITALGPVSAPPTVTGDPTINGGAVQRSLVTSLAVTFGEAVVVSPGAFTLTASPMDGDHFDWFHPADPGLHDGRDSLHLDVRRQRRGAKRFPGRWRLGAEHQSSARHRRDRRRTGMAADYNSPTSGSNRIYRLFGDFNGDGSVTGGFRGVRVGLQRRPERPELPVVL